MKKTPFLIVFFISVLITACNIRDDYVTVPLSIEGYRPVYFDTNQNIANLVYTTSPVAVKNPGKIYLYKQYLFVGEPSLGVHVFDNSNPSSPLPLVFINIPYNYDIAVKDSILYADTYAGLVVINIANLPQIKVVNYMKNLYQFPPVPDGSNAPVSGRNRNIRTYFECPDPERGIVVGWDKATLEEPKCYH